MVSEACMYIPDVLLLLLSLNRAVDMYSMLLVNILYRSLEGGEQIRTPPQVPGYRYKVS